MKAFIISILIMFGIAAGAIQLIKADHEPEITEKKYNPQAGYETPKTEYDITVSPAWRWKHGGNSTWLVILGFVVLGLAGLYIGHVNAEWKKVNWLLLIILVVGGYSAILGKYSWSYYGEKYSKRFTQEQYESSKENVEKLFE